MRRLCLKKIFCAADNCDRNIYNLFCEKMLSFITVICTVCTLTVICLNYNINSSENIFILMDKFLSKVSKNIRPLIFPIFCWISLMTDFYVIFLENYSEYLNKACYLTIRQALFLFLWIKSIGMIEINCHHMETLY